MIPFSRTYTIRGYEVDSSRTVALPAMLSYLEQLRWEWMADPWWSLTEGLHQGHFFVVSRQQLELVERPRFGERLTVEGRMESVGRSRLIVRHRLLIDDRLIGHARVTAIWLGPDRRLARIPAATRALGREHADTGPFPSLPTPTATQSDLPSFLDAPRQLFPPQGLALPEPDAPFTPDHEQTLTVRASDCDVFKHVNASTWLKYCNDVRRERGFDAVANRVDIQYQQEALPGDHLHIGCVELPSSLGFELRRDGTLLCHAVLAY